MIRGRMDGPNGRALKAWIAEHMPNLNAELGPMTLDRVRHRLNDITGCNIQGSSSIEETSAVFLAALKGLYRTSSEPINRNSSK